LDVVDAADGGGFQRTRPLLGKGRGNRKGTTRREGRENERTEKKGNIPE